MYDSRHTPSERTELAAMDVRERAEARGERITLAMCVERLVRSHRPRGRCGRAGAGGGEGEAAACVSGGVGVAAVGGRDRLRMAR